MHERRLLRLIEQLESDRLTGRITIKGVASGWVYVSDGRVYCAERRDHPTLLASMAEAELFTPKEWETALRLPIEAKWEALVGGDPGRLEILAEFAFQYVRDALAWLVRHDHDNTTFAPRIAHPFGALRTWSVSELVDETAIEDADTDARLPIDREEFIELLLEVSPVVRPPRKAPSL